MPNIVACFILETDVGARSDLSARKAEEHITNPAGRAGGCRGKRGWLTCRPKQLHLLRRYSSDMTVMTVYLPLDDDSKQFKIDLTWIGDAD